MHLNFWEVIVLLSLAQGVVFGVIFLNSKMPFHSDNNKFLALSILILSIIGLDELLETKQINDHYYILELLGSDIPWHLLFYVPMFVYFIKSANHPLAKSEKLWWLTTPFALFLFLNFIIDLQVDFNQMDWPIIKQWQVEVYQSEYFLSMFCTVILCTLSFFIISKSRISGGEKKWLRKIWAFGASILSIWIISEFMPDDIYDNWNGEITYPVWIAFAFFVFWLTFKGLYQLELAKDKSAIQKILRNQHLKKNQTLNNTARDSSPLHQYYENFIQLLEKEKLFLNPDLNRDEIAERLGISPSYLTQAITSMGDDNLTAIINSYRVREVKEMLKKTSFRAFSIMAIGLEAGFKSKSAFYDSFKKETGLTPNQFKMLANES